MRSRAIRIVLLAFTLLIVTTMNVSSSGPVGMFAVIERVVFEPNEQAPERIQLWGAFAFVAGGIQGSFTAPAQRGYLYFAMVPSYSQQQRENTKKEWADLKAVAGTGQGVAFGDWFYTGAFTEANNGGVYATNGGSVKVNSAAPVKTAPIPYSLNTGVVKLSSSGSQAAVVDQLKALIKK
jgi:hypothetical protein